MRKISVNFDEFDVYSCTLYIAQINLDGRRAPAHAIEHRRHLMAHAILESMHIMATTYSRLRYLHVSWYVHTSAYWE